MLDAVWQQLCLNDGGRRITVETDHERIAMAGRAIMNSIKSKKLASPRAIWLTVPAAVVDSSLADLAARLSPDDVIIDGGNSYYIDDIRRAGELKSKGIHYLDVGTSGGI